MMSFGWRPMMSCYAADDQAVVAAVAPAEKTAAPACSQSPTWFYAALAIAAAAGIAHKGGKR